MPARAARRRCVPATSCTLPPLPACHPRTTPACTRLARPWPLPRTVPPLPACHPGTTPACTRFARPSPMPRAARPLGPPSTFPTRGLPASRPLRGWGGGGACGRGRRADEAHGGGETRRHKEVAGGRATRGEVPAAERGVPLEMPGTSAGATDFRPSSLNQSDGPRMIGHHPMGNLCETRDMEADYKTKISEKKNFRGVTGERRVVCIILIHGSLVHCARRG